MYTYQPRRPVKSFQDLEVYQRLESIAVVIVKRLQTDIANQSPRVISIMEKLFDNLLAIPVILASAHSRRFGEQTEAILKLDEAMLRCNLSVVYLELYRDLANHHVEIDFFEENIKNILSVRGKVLHLQMSWKKFSQTPAS